LRDERLAKTLDEPNRAALIRKGMALLLHQQPPGEAASEVRSVYHEPAHVGVAADVKGIGFEE
jgi:hypothetical protein